MNDSPPNLVKTMLPTLITLVALALTILPLASIHGATAPLFSSAIAGPTTMKWMPAATTALETELVSRHGDSQRARIHRGLQQVADYWRAGDGERAVFEDFVVENFASDPATLDTTFERFEFLLEKMYGHANEIRLAMRRQTDLDLGPILPMDRISAGYSVADHYRASRECRAHQNGNGLPRQVSGGGAVQESRPAAAAGTGRCSRTERSGFEHAGVAGFAAQ